MNVRLICGRQMDMNIIVLKQDIADGTIDTIYIEMLSLTKQESRQ